MKVFRPMFEVLPEGVEGIATVSHIDVDEHASAMTSIQAMQHGRDAFVEPGVYTRLTVGKSLMMTDTRMEQRSNIGVVMEAKGHVLIAGLGIGMILLPLLEKPEVKSVTVVEKYADVVKLVEPHVLAVVGKNAPKLKTIVADIFEWVPPKGEKWDTIYFDIWPDLSMDNLEQMEILHRKFARRKAPGAWMYSWQKDYLKYRKRAGW